MKGRAGSTALLGLSVMLACAAVHAPDALALPAGRSWSSWEAVSYPLAGYFAGPRLDVDSLGVPVLITKVYFTGDGKGWGVFTWRDSAWSDPLYGGFPDALHLPPPVLSLTSQRFLLWINQTEPSYLLWSEVLADRITPAESVAVTTQQGTEYSGAASAHRHWVLRSQQRPQPNTTFRIRTLYSDTARIWHEMPELGIDEDHCVMAPLGDTTAIVVYAGASGLAWAIAEGNHWGSSGKIDTRPWVAAHPRFRFRPSGGLWLLWTEPTRVHVSSYKDGVWTWGDTLTCAHPPGQTFYSAWTDASRDTAERPILAWSDVGYDYTYRTVACVAFPTDSGWTRGEEVPGSDEGWDPKVAQDRNGDAWVAWTPLGHGWVSILHTYVSATTSEPRFENDHGIPVVRWTLSGPAPRTYWAVERAAVGGEFAELARVRAGPSLELMWTDTTAPAGTPLRYRIRRESVDARYRWWSPEALWDQPTGVQVSFGGATVEPDHARLVWQVSGGTLATLALERRTTDTAWQAIAAVAPDGTGRVIYEDAEVVPGSRYGYRLTNTGAGVTSAATWIEIPPANRLWLAGLRPNPAGRGGKIHFSLADGSPARLEVFDVKGRRVMAEEVGTLGPGSHVLEFPKQGLHPGVYLLRLTQGRTALTTRGVVIE